MPKVFLTGGTRPRLISGDIDIQIVTKQSVETWPKKGCVSTLSFKWYLIISGLRNAPWPRPAWYTGHIEYAGHTEQSRGRHGDDYLPKTPGDHEQARKRTRVPLTITLRCGP